ncbi:cytochrome c3 family protein [Aeoliella sp.]|uniref:cytochrome c3 family protein n=1 Tax=Aeoliella sp. TaxID=2795800 RepID=UPI003CCC3B9B
MTRWTIIILVLIAGVAVAYGAGWIPSEAREVVSHSMHQAVNPGPLSAAHANLANNCNACHTPVKGVDTAKCVLCHANNESILQRQPTAFHASVNTCKQCHLEHRGVDAKLSLMDHSLLTGIAMKQMQDAEPGTEELAAYLRLSEKLDSGVSPHSRISLNESVLDCASCHSNDDRHQSLFGSDCAQCHATDRWTIPEYKHPTPQSTDCSQCHQAPPSHYMMHFKMISARVAGKPHARVDQCGQCHQTTSWNDIKRVGWYKHH